MTLPTLNAIDLITTLFALSMGAVELNPLMATLSPTMMIIVKLCAMPLCWWLRGKQSYKWVCAVYLYWVINNLIICMTLR